MSCEDGNPDDFGTRVADGVEVLQEMVESGARRSASVGGKQHEVWQPSEGTVDNFVAVESTQKPQVSTGFNTLLVNR